MIVIQIYLIFSYNDVKLNISDYISMTAYPYQLEGIKWLKFFVLKSSWGMSS